MPLAIASTKNSYRAGSTWVPAEAAPPVVSTTGGTGTSTFSDNGAGGTFTTINTTSATYVPANKTQVVTITATDGALATASRTIDVVATFPLNATWGNEEQLDRNTTVQRARGGTKYMREEDETEYTGQLDSLNRSNAELAAIQAFWRFHRKIVPFHYLDMDTGVDQIVRFTSPLRWKKGGADSWDIFSNVIGNDAAVLYDLEPPVVTMVTPAENAVVSGASVLLSATITDNIGVQSLRFQVNGANVGALLITAPWQINWNSTSVANGVHYISAVGQDTSNNLSYAYRRKVTVNN